MITFFDLVINLLEGLIVIGFIYLSQLGFKIYKIKTFVFFSLLLFTAITLYNYFNLSSWMCSFLMLSVTITYSHVISTNNLSANIYIALVSQLLTLCAATISLAISDMIVIFTNITLSYSTVVIISKLLYLVFGILIALAIYKNISSSIEKQPLFAISLFLLIILYITIFDSLFLGNTNHSDSYIKLVTLVLFTFFIYKLFSRSIKDQQEKYQMNILYKEQEVKNRNFDQTEKAIKEISTLKHDLKHILQLIKFNLDNNNHKKINEIIDSQLNIIANTSKVYATGNQSLDYILYQNADKLKDIDVICNYFRFYPLKFDKIDYFIMIGNIFDNAVENCKANPNKKIVIDRGIKNNLYYFKISNSIDQKIIKNNPTLMTTKPDARNHGIGINNIKQIVHKYNGSIDFYDDGIMFTCIIYFPI